MGEEKRRGAAEAGMSQVKVSDGTWKGYETRLIPEKTGGKLMHHRRAPLRDSRLADGNIIMAYTYRNLLPGVIVVGLIY